MKYDRSEIRSVLLIGGIYFLFMYWEMWNEPFGAFKAAGLTVVYLLLFVYPMLLFARYLRNAEWAKLSELGYASIPLTVKVSRSPDEEIYDLLKRFEGMKINKLTDGFEVRYLDAGYWFHVVRFRKVGIDEIEISIRPLIFKKPFVTTMFSLREILFLMGVSDKPRATWLTTLNIFGVLPILLVSLLILSYSLSVFLVVVAVTSPYWYLIFRRSRWAYRHQLQLM